jgi:hypothetical protein
MTRGHERPSVWWPRKPDETQSSLRPALHRVRPVKTAVSTVPPQDGRFGAARKARAGPREGPRNLESGSLTPRKAR